jgi:flagellar biosynthesis chaperone FliJ
METMNTNRQLLDYSKENTKLISDKIKTFVSDKGYVISGEINISNDISFESQKKSKVFRKYLTKLSHNMSQKIINRFLHFLYKKIYKEDTSPRVLLSEKETKIQDARKAWKNHQIESERLLNLYKEEKGDFYK